MPMPPEDLSFSIFSFLADFSKKCADIMHTLDSHWAPEQNYQTPLDVFEQTLKHEEWVTEKINELADVADAELDRASINFVGQFIDEQQSVREFVYGFPKTWRVFYKTWRVFYKTWRVMSKTRRVLLITRHFSICLTAGHFFRL